MAAIVRYGRWSGKSACNVHTGKTSRFQCDVILESGSTDPIRGLGLELI